jgi:signal transduction histidine kinase
VAPGGRAEAGPPDSAPVAGAPARSDLQQILARAASRLAAALGATRVFVWEDDPAGCDPASPDLCGVGRPVLGRPPSPAVRAACLEGGTLAAPNAVELAALASLDRAIDLGSAGASAPLRALAERHGVAAAAAVPRGDAGPSWVILAGGGRLRAGEVSPRDLAQLQATAERLAAPTALAAAASRLAQLDADVRRLDRLASVGSLVSEIVHEIRNPLVSVKTFLQLLPERGGEPEFQESFLRLASEELRRVERLLDLVLDHARPSADAADGAPAAEVAAAAASIAQLVSHRAAERGVAVTEEAEGEGLRVALSSDGLRQVLLNLTLNAIDASPEGGRVRIAARRRGEGVEITVSDEGPGVAPEHRSRVFEPFFSTKPGRPGGLGLAISRRIAEEAGGRLELHSAREGGTRFVLTLPA